MLAPGRDPASDCRNDGPGAGGRALYKVSDVLVAQFPRESFYMCSVAACDSGPQEFIVQFDRFHDVLLLIDNEIAHCSHCNIRRLRLNFQSYVRMRRIIISDSRFLARRWTRRFGGHKECGANDANTRFGCRILNSTRSAFGRRSNCHRCQEWPACRPQPLRRIACAGSRRSACHRATRTCPSRDSKQRRPESHSHAR
jgi:hypothetical protein